MSPTPLQFARDYERFTSEIAHIDSDDQRLLATIEFWPTLAEVADKAHYSSYREEYLSLLPKLLTPDVLTDLTLDELERIRRALEQIAQVAHDSVSISELIDRVAYHLASLLCWLGEPDRAIAALGERPPDLPDTEERPHEAMRLLRWYQRQLPEDSGARGTLQRIYDQWQGYQDAVWDDRVNCLLVDYQGGRPRGRMRTLTGVVETRGNKKSKDRTEDHVAVDTQLKSPDDPFAGVIYKALKAVRTELHRSGMTRTYRNELLNADYFLNESTITITGDSIGLAAALIAYAQLLKPEVMRHEKYISGGIAVTGSIDEDGNILPVSEETLAAKVTRAFHSPVSALVLPQEHVDAASTVVTELQQNYRHRRLHIIAAPQLPETVQDRNIIRSEKVCMGQYMVRTVNKYTRATRVQVPILLILSYLLICLLYPKAWVGFDWNPAEVEVVSNGFVVYNADGDELWSQTYSWELIADGPTRGMVRSQHLLANIDSDEQHEVFFLPGSTRRIPIPDVMKNRVFVYDDDGSLLFRCSTAVLSQYPADTVNNHAHNPTNMFLLNMKEHRVLHVGRVDENPARAHNRFYSIDGQPLGWYVTSGAIGFPFVLGSDTVALAGFNNRLDRAQLSVIDPTTVRGVGPPYGVVDGIDLTGVMRADHMAVVVFPISDIRVATATKYSSIMECRKQSDALLVHVAETRARIAKINYNRLYYYFDASFRLRRVVPDDDFIAFRDSLVRAGDLPHIPWDVYNDSLERAVEYWTDSGWVTEGQLRDAEAAQAALSASE